MTPFATTSSSNSSSSAGASSTRPLHAFLAAVSFEHPHRWMGGRSRPPSPDPIDAKTVESTQSVLTTPTKNSKHHASEEHPVVTVKNVLHGTLDPDGGVEDVYYDASDVGDGVTADEFSHVHKRRESIVLASISSPPRGGALLPSRSNDSEPGVSPRELHNPPPPPLPPQVLPLRFLRAGKGDSEEGLRRYEATLAWRQEYEIDTILRQPHENFDTIKEHYLHYCHFTGKQGEPCFYEKPAKTNLKALRKGGVHLKELLRHYAMIQEFHWQMLERDDLCRSIYIIDLEGIRMMDFAGEVIDFVKKASEFTSQHYPERAGCVFIINVPGWFKLIWNVVKPWIDEVTLKKIYILRGKEEIRKNMQERIPLEHLPPSYGGTSCELGESPQEDLLRDLVRHNNALARGEDCSEFVVKGQCRFCSWVPARSY